MFLRSWTNDMYLLYREVPDRDPTGFTTESYFQDVLKTSLTTASGRAKDQFHFTYPTDVWEDLSQAGIEPGIEAPAERIYKRRVCETRPERIGGRGHGVRKGIAHCTPPPMRPAWPASRSPIRASK